MKVNKKIAISESGFLFNSATGDSYSLNPIGVEILEMIKNEQKPEEIKRKLLEKYDVTKSVLEKSYNEFVDTLKKLNLIVNE